MRRPIVGRLRQADAEVDRAWIEMIVQAFEMARNVVDLRRCKAPRRRDLRVDEADHFRIERRVRPVVSE